MLGLLVAEGVAVCCGSVVALSLILRALMAHRATVFSVFLAVPNAALRTLANKSTVIGDEEEESDDGARRLCHALRCCLARCCGAGAVRRWTPSGGHAPTTPTSPRRGRARRCDRGRGAEEAGACGGGGGGGGRQGGGRRCRRRRRRREHAAPRQHRGPGRQRRRQRGARGESPRATACLPAPLCACVRGCLAAGRPACSTPLRTPPLLPPARRCRAPACWTR